MALKHSKFPLARALANQFFMMAYSQQGQDEICTSSGVHIGEILNDIEILGVAKTLIHSG